MNCTFENLLATFEITSPINSDGVATAVIAPSEYGYHCTSCGLGFANWANALSHIMQKEVPLHRVDAATDELKVKLGEQENLTFQAETPRSTSIEVSNIPEAVLVDAPVPPVVE